MRKTTPSSASSAVFAPSSAATDAGRWAGLGSLLRPLASLKLTVCLFALSMVLVLAGTLAQIDHDIWYVVHHYFRAWLAWIDWQVFFPRAWGLSGGFWFPGGWSLGAALGLNLLAAHTLRFRVVARGRARWLGGCLLALGVWLTWFVVQRGLDGTVESELSPAFCDGLWQGLRLALAAGTLGMGYLLAVQRQAMMRDGGSWCWWFAAITCVGMASLTAWLVAHPEAQLDPAGLRILWQLIKGGAAGLVLLASCYVLFGRRAGIVLLHGGIALLMFSELLTGLQAQEAQMRIAEGQTIHYAEDHRSTELAVIDKSDPHQDRVWVVPSRLLLQATAAGQVLDDPALPFAVRVVEHLPHARTRFLQPGENSPATHGVGLLRVGVPLPANTGVGQRQGVDVPLMYVEFIRRDREASLGTFCLSPLLLNDVFRLDDRTYEVALRFQRMQKPYAIKLIDFRYDRYVGTNTPKNFSSEIELIDVEQNVNRNITISMNNPLRYLGDTLYQADWDKATERGTVLQVMTNAGWMIPYVACMLVATGMLAQFGATFLRFARRQRAPAVARGERSFRSVWADWRTPAVWVPSLCLLTFVGYAASKARVPQLPSTQMQIYQFGQLPVAYNGRIKPVDTVARNALTLVSGKAELEASGGRPGGKSQNGATRWLLDVISGVPRWRQQRILRIENLDVLQALDLKPRQGFRYSLSEVLAKKFLDTDLAGQQRSTAEVMRQVQLASEVEEASRNLTQVKFAELGRQLVTLRVLREAFSPPAVRTDSFEHLQADFEQVAKQIARLNVEAPQVVPPLRAGDPWQTLLEAERDALFQQVRKQPVNPATWAWRSLLEAYAAEDTQKFNQQLAAYQVLMQDRAAADAQLDAQQAEQRVGARKEAEKLRLERVQFEAFFNHFNPFKLAMAMYLFAFVLAAGSWLGWNRTLNRSANWLLWFTFLLHTYALVCRIYISGRPPVTNLYSSAIFIGWAAVLFALVLEQIYRFGMGNLLAAVVGFPTLFVAYNLAGDGDTFQVLQAVLDTQFWLATHVVCITLGYSTTLLAGALGLAYVLLSQLANRLTPEQRQQLTRMTYGTLCFATFFSFVGTVLGGLWADDSWGRFWGWDPKENGALLIVIWNALVLHARWGALVGPRGMAVLAIFGNVVTAWSWFGVNQMGQGLHAYGFRKGMTFWLLVFVASQLLVMAAAWVPRRLAK